MKSKQELYEKWEKEQRLRDAAPDLLEALQDLIERVNRARNNLTNGHPSPENYWAILDTTWAESAIRQATATNQ